MTAGSSPWSRTPVRTSNRATKILSPPTGEPAVHFLAPLRALGPGQQFLYPGVS